MSADNEAANEVNRYKGIAGWLAFLFIGLALSSLLLVVGAINNSLHSGDYATLYGNHWLGPFSVIWDVIYFILFGIGAIFILKKKLVARKLVIHSLWTFAVINVFLVNAQMIDANNAVAVGTITKAAADSWTSSVGSDAGRAILAALIWIPYLRRSKRVRFTLIN